ncbi:hypothetical protein L1987_68332 [Smallanthus sonchifolius]|uniref:Uncharacterized protein n=1 Tax=Smallanthus sonchifolius TaxID=185202 RepID=A0ACB9B5I2_9ASTR|nr:hypothetical protein L1987_68332 [Smallanthus sonchifolius]
MLTAQCLSQVLLVQIKHAVTAVGSGQTSVGIKEISCQRVPSRSCCFYSDPHQTHEISYLLVKKANLVSMLMNIIKGKQICNANDDQKSPS